MRQVTLDEAKARFLDLVEDAIGGEVIVITKDDRPVVQLVPASQARRRPQFGSARGLVELADDFDEPLVDFDEYMG